MRLDVQALAPSAVRSFKMMEKVVAESSLDKKLLELVCMRASQINGCARCMDLHARRSRALGEDERRIVLLTFWRETTLFSAKERAALAWCEALTEIARFGAPDEIYGALQEAFAPEEIVALTMAVVAINGRNRVNVAFALPLDEDGGA